MAQYSDIVRNSQLNSIEAGLGTGPTLEIRSGTAPASADDPSTGDLLASIQLPNDWLTTAVDGVKESSEPWETEEALESGEPEHYRITGNSNCIQGSVSGPSGNGEILLSDDIITQGRPVSLTQVTVISTAHPSTSDYIRRVHNVGGSLRGGTQTVAQRASALDRFFTQLDHEGLRSLIREAYLLCGVSYEGLSAKLVHDEGVPPNLVLNNFVSGDYKRDGLLAGLKGNGSTSFIDTDFLRAALPETVSLSAFVTEDGPSEIANWVGNVQNGFGAVLQRVNNTNVRFNNNGGDSTGARMNHSSYTPAYWTGVASGEEPNRIRRLFRNGQSPATDSIDRIHTIGVRSFVLFAVRNHILELTNFSPHRLAFIHAGLELSETQVEDLNTVVQQLMVDLGVITEPLTT